MNTKKITAALGLFGLCFSGFWWVHAHASEQLAKKVDNETLQQLITSYHVQKIRELKRERQYLELKEVKTQADKFMIGDIAASIDELEASLRQ